MRIYFHQLIHLPVVTRMGVKLGQVQDVEIEVETHGVVAYSVGGKFFGKDAYRIVPGQVVCITDTEMIVDDAILKDRAASESVVGSRVSLESVNSVQAE